MLFRSNNILRTHHFDAVDSDINLGVHDESQSPIAQSVLAYCYPRGSGEGGFGYLFGKTPNLSSNGPRFFVDHNTGTARFGFGAFTASGGAVPTKTALNGSIVYNNWYHLGATWNGDIFQTGIALYHGRNNAPLILSSIQTSQSGSAGPSGGPGNQLHIGNRNGLDRTFNGTIAYVARWNRVLSLSELRHAQQFGPLSVPNGLILCWANGRDYGPYGIQPVAVQALAPGLTPRSPILGPGARSSLWAAIVGGGGGGQFALGSVTLATAGALGITGSLDVPRYWVMPTDAANGTVRTMVVLSDDMTTVIDQGPVTASGGVFRLLAANQTIDFGTKQLAVIHNWDGNPATTSIRGGTGITEAAA